jgi:hypothetical protein
MPIWWCQQDEDDWLALGCNMTARAEEDLDDHFNVDQVGAAGHGVPAAPSPQPGLSLSHPQPDFTHEPFSGPPVVRGPLPLHLLTLPYPPAWPAYPALACPITPGGFPVTSSSNAGAPYPPDPTPTLPTPAPAPTSPARSLGSHDSEVSTPM